jgi:hypothetical protein
VTWSSAAPNDIGYLYTAGGTFKPNRAAGPEVGEAAIRLRAAISPLTFTAVPPGSGRRIGIDRDLDGVLDGDE